MKINVILFSFMLLGSIAAHGQELFLQQDEKGKYGFVDEAGTFVIKPQYDDVHFEFTNGIACVQVKKKYFFIDAKGDKMSRKTYNWVGYFDKNNLCLVNSGGKMNDKGEAESGKFGYVNYQVEEVVPVKYSSVGKFNEHGVAFINQGGSYDKEGDFDGGKYGFIDLLGKELIAPKYTRVGDFDENGVAWVNVGGKENSKTGVFAGGQFGYVNNKGIELIAPKYTFVGPLVDGICWINKGGKVLVPEKDALYKAAAKRMQSSSKSFTRTDRENLITVITGGKRDACHTPVKGGKFGFADAHGREITKIKYIQTANHFTEDRAWVQLGKKYGYVDTGGKEITKIIYEKVSPEFHNSMATVQLKKKRGVINHTGREVTKIEYLNVGEFESGYTWIKQYPEKKGKKTGPAKYALINENGIPITPFKYDLVKTDISEGLIGAMYDGGWCFVNGQGEEITPNHFVDVKKYEEGVAWARIKESDSNAALASIHNSSMNSLVSLEMSQLKGVGKIQNIKEEQNRIQGLGHGRYGLINKGGEALTPFEYISVNDFSDGLALASKVKELTVTEAEEIEKMMQEHSALQSEMDEDAKNITASSQKLTTYLTTKSINKNLSNISDMVAKNKHLENKNARIAEKTTRSGYINRKGEVVVPFQYVTGLPFINGIATVKGENNKWGFINKQGEEFIPCQYDNVSKGFQNGVAAVLINEKWGGVSMDGELVIPALLDEVEYIFDITESADSSDSPIKFTERQAKVYNLHKSDKPNSYSIKATIPDDMWDF